MRVIAGTARSIVLDVAEKSPTRPFLEKARGALFNSLGAAVLESKALDLYAGSGALGIEALSRGARSCIFIELDGAAFKVLSNNVTKCGFTKRARLIRGNALGEAKNLSGSFDLIFVDPPFPDAVEWAKGEEGRELGEALVKLLSPEGVAVLRIEDDKASPPQWPNLTLTRENRYGRSRICRYALA